MYILTQDRRRIVPFRDTDTIALDDGRIFDYDTMKYSDMTAFYLYLYRSDLEGTKELLGTFNTRKRGEYAISEIVYAIENRRNLVEIPNDRDNET